MSHFKDSLNDYYKQWIRRGNFINKFIDIVFIWIEHHKKNSISFNTHPSVSTIKKDKRTLEFFFFEFRNSTVSWVTKEHNISAALLCTKTNHKTTKRLTGYQNFTKSSHHVLLHLLENVLLQMSTIRRCLVINVSLCCITFSIVSKNCHHSVFSGFYYFHYQDLSKLT